MSINVTSAATTAMPEPARVVSSSTIEIPSATQTVVMPAVETGKDDAEETRFKPADIITPRPGVLVDGNQRGTPTTIGLEGGGGAPGGSALDVASAVADVLGAVLGAISGASQPKAPSAPRKQEEPVKAGGSGPGVGDWLGRLADAVVDLGKTWGDWRNTTESEFNFGHNKVDGELWGRDGDGDITWADNGAKVSPDQVDAMPEPQRQEFFRRVGIEPVPDRQVSETPDPAVMEPPAGVPVPTKQVQGGGQVETSEAPAESKPVPAAEDQPAPADANSVPAAEEKPAAPEKPPALPLGKKQTILSVADPHITSADGLKYDNKLPGDFILASSNRGNFDVQVRQGALPGDSGVWQTAAAVKTDAHVVQYDAQRNMVNIDGKDHAFKPGQRIALSDGAYVQMSREANPGDGRTRGFDRVQVHTAQGDDVYMLNFARGKNHQMDVRVDVSGTRLDGEVSGIGGRVDRDTNAANDLVMRDGTVTTKANEDAAANSWRVRSGESILP